MRIEEHIPLGPLTTFHIGGSARFLVRVQNIEELRKSLDFARDQNQRVLILGGGSNVLMSDAEVDGLVIKIEIKGIVISSDLVMVGAGEAWDDIVAYAVEKNLWGIENLSGIPGTVGGAVSGNIGAYGQALSQTLFWVDVLDTQTHEVKKLSSAACEFGYRESVFTQHPGRYIVIRAAFKLSNDPNPELSYKDLAEAFAADAAPQITTIREHVLAIRASKFPDLETEGTAGSFFKNPIVDSAQAKVLQDRYPTMPIFPMPETSGYKVPLAWLLDHVLGLRGFTHGAARLFEKQPLVIVAMPDASVRDVTELANIVSKKVFETFGITVEFEVKIIS